MQRFSRLWQKTAALTLRSEAWGHLLCLAGLVASLMLLAHLAEASAPEGVEEGHAYIPAGTELSLRLEREVSSKDVSEGDFVPVVVLGDLRLNGVVVIRSKADVRAVVAKNRPAGVYGRSGLLVIEMKSVQTENGITVPLRGTEEKKVAHHDNALTQGVVGGLFIRGAQAVYKKGSFFTAVVDTDVDLGVSKEDLARVMCEQGKVAAAP